MPYPVIERKRWHSVEAHRFGSYAAPGYGAWTMAKRCEPIVIFIELESLGPSRRHGSRHEDTVSDGRALWCDRRKRNEKLAGLLMLNNKPLSRSLLLGEIVSHSPFPCHASRGIHRAVGCRWRAN
jgi:hypothetical protein